MPRGIPNVKIEEAPEAVAVKMVPMKLDRHYRPYGAFEIVGYHKPEVKKKNSAGIEFVAEPSEFISGEKAPPPFPGVGFDSKVWAGTVIRLPEDEAKVIRKAGIGSLEFED